MSQFAIAAYSSRPAMVSPASTIARRPAYNREASYRTLSSTAGYQAKKFVVGTQIAKKPPVLVAAEYAVALISLGIAAYLSFGL